MSSLANSLRSSAAPLLVSLRVLIDSNVGFTLAALYNAGFKMSTWIPFFWGLIQMFTVVSAGYSTVSSIL